MKKTIIIGLGFIVLAAVVLLQGQFALLIWPLIFGLLQ